MSDYRGPMGIFEGYGEYDEPVSPPNALLPTEEGKPHCPFCGKQPVTISRMTWWCDGMVDGKEVHNTIGMRPESWPMRALAKPDEGVVDRITAWLYRREGAIAFDCLRPAEQEHWRRQAREVAALASLSDNEVKP